VPRDLSAHRVPSVDVPQGLYATTPGFTHASIRLGDEPASPTRAYSGEMTSEHELLRSLDAERGEEAMRVLYQLYGAELYGFALQRLRDRELAEETIQDVFTQAWRKARQFDPERGSVRTWLYGIARNAVVGTWRRKRARPALVEHPPEELGAVEEPIEQTLLR
jgi:hypothetical protein